MSEDHLSMFFDEDFEPTAYVDALFNNVMHSKSTQSSLAVSSQLYSEKNLHSLQNKCSSLSSHLDFYTNELSSQLSEKLDLLKDASSIISSSSDDPITRLQYYINSMANAVASLQQEVDAAQEHKQHQSAHLPVSSTEDPEIDSNSLKTVETCKNVEPIETLGSLREVKIKLLAVLDVFEQFTAIAQTGDNDEQDIRPADYGSITVELFTNSMSTLHKTIQKGFSDQDFSTINQELIYNVDSLSSYLPVFQGTAFHSIYKSYISKILSDRDRYLSMRK